MLLFRTAPAENKLEENKDLEGIDVNALTFVDISKKSYEEQKSLKEHHRRVWERRTNGELWSSAAGFQGLRDRTVKAVY